MLKFCKTLLKNRIQRSVLEDAISDWNDIQPVLPQDSAKSPIFFFILINDLLNNLATTVEMYSESRFLMIQ